MDYPTNGKKIGWEEFAKMNPKPGTKVLGYCGPYTYRLTVVESRGVLGGLAVQYRETAVLNGPFTDQGTLFGPYPLNNFHTYLVATRRKVGVFKP